MLYIFNGVKVFQIYRGIFDVPLFKKDDTVFLPSFKKDMVVGDVAPYSARHNLSPAFRTFSCIHIRSLFDLFLFEAKCFLPHGLDMVSSHKNPPLSLRDGGGFLCFWFKKAASCGWLCGAGAVVI